MWSRCHADIDATNAADIATNATAITANGTTIDAAAAAIADLEVDLGDVETDLASNATAIAANTSAIDDGGDVKTGSHNLVIGDHHTYEYWAGLVAGHDTFGDYSTVSGGGGEDSLDGNTASSDYSTVSGGSALETSGVGEHLP